MDPAQHSRIVSFIWSVADDELRDVYQRGKYRDVILPMTVIRRIDALLEPTKKAVLATHEQLTAKGIAIDHQDPVLRKTAGLPFYNTSQFTLRELRNHQTQLRDNFEAYLKGFSKNIRDIIERFGFMTQVVKLDEKKLIDAVLEKFTSRDVNFSSKPVMGKNAAGEEVELLPAMTNHDMGYVFEELLRKFNEENNEEAGEHFTPREVVRLMASLLFLPVAGEIKDNTYLVYDCACGSGGMLTESEAMLKKLATEHQRNVSVRLYGQEINDETYAICKADMLIKGEDESNIRPGTTLGEDAFPRMNFDFMLANPPYGKSWKSDLERMGGKGEMKDSRFIIDHAGDPEYSLITRSSDGQLMFLVNMLSKMKHDTVFGSRVATIHNGSSLFTGDAGQGESNIRRWIIEKDWLEAIIALPLKLFYNTGIATYVWVISNRKPKHRTGKVQLIDATRWSRPLRKNLGQKSVELGSEDSERILKTFMAFEESECSKVFRNEAFGYWKVTVERPLRLRGLDGERVYSPKELKALRATHPVDPEAPPVLRKLLKASTKAATLTGLFPVKMGGRVCVVEYEPDSDLRDTEQVPLLEEGGIAGFIRREVLPHAPDAWVDDTATRVGYEVSFNRYFYKPQAMRTLEQIRADILAVQKESEGLLAEILGGGGL